MSSNYPSIVHERIALARRGENKTVICKMKSGWVVLGDDQRLSGYSLLLHDPIVDDLNVLTKEDRIQFLSDMAVIGDALTAVLKPSIINYSILGNADRALHAHIHPRYDSEESDKRKTIPFIYNLLKYPKIEFDYEKNKELIQKLKNAIVDRT